jgi:phosphohistidine phosphatase
MRRLSHVAPALSTYGRAMHLLVIRHAVAEDKQLLEDDSTRRLTPRGVKKFRGVVRGLERLEWGLDRVYTSPWVRAARTAELLAPLGGGTPIETELLARAPRAELLAQVTDDGGGLDPHHAVALVGHEPWLGELISWLAFGDARHGEGLVMKKGGVVWLEGSATPGGMSLRASFPPAVLRALA